jgi:hypothetical protein
MGPPTPPPPPTHDLDLTTGIFTFDNGHVTIVAQTNAVLPLPDSITVQSVTLTNPHDFHVLGVADLVVPDHLFDLLGH